MNINDFNDRLTLGIKHEESIREALRLRGWLAEPFGQAMISETMRSHLRKVDTPVRRLPDIIAAKGLASGEQIIFIEAKGGKRYRETGKHDVELASLESAEAFIDYSGGCPFYFVFDKGGVATPEDIREVCWPGYFNGRGSGTPFVLFPVDICRSFASVFGEKPSEQATGWSKTFDSCFTTVLTRQRGSAAPVSERESE